MRAATLCLAQPGESPYEPFALDLPEWAHDPESLPLELGLLEITRPELSEDAVAKNKAKLVMLEAETRLREVVQAASRFRRASVASAEAGASGMSRAPRW